MLPIISAEERLKERHSAKVALVGAAGVGKTSQIRTLPAKSTLFVDLEAGDLSVRDWPGDTVRPRTWPEFRDLIVFLAGPMPTASAEQAFSQAHFDHVCTKFGDPAQLAKYEFYFVDSLTVLSRLCFAWCKTQPYAYGGASGKRQRSQTIKLALRFQHANTGLDDAKLKGDRARNVRGVARVSRGV